MNDTVTEVGYGVLRLVSMNSLCFFFFFLSLSFQSKNMIVYDICLLFLRFSTILLKDFTNPLEHLTLNSWKIMMFCHEG